MTAGTEAAAIPNVEEATEAPIAPPDKGARYAAWVFGIAAVAAFFMFLVIGRNMWFWLDEWEFLAHRSLNAHDVFEPYAGHLVALPVVVYRALFTVFGLRTYLPYQVLSVGAHVMAAVLLRMVMRRAAINPWIATAAAGLFLFFGSGGQDILFGFQITFVGALVFGLGQLLLADHDGPVDRRDGLAVASGLVALLCSGVAVTMVIVVGLATLARRGWRVAALQTAPLAAVFGLWLLLGDGPKNRAATRDGLLRWDQRGITQTFRALGHINPVGWILGALLVGGLILAWRQRGRALLHTSAVLPLAMLVGALIFITVAGFGRAKLGATYAGSSRYLDIVAALVLPAIALAADCVVRASRGSRVVTAVLVGLLIVGIPGNVQATTRTVPPKGYRAIAERQIRILPRLDLATQVPRTVKPLPNLAPFVSIGWLLDAARAGRLRGPLPVTPQQRAGFELLLALTETPGVVDAECTPASFKTPITRRLLAGDSVVVRGSVLVRGKLGDEAYSGWIDYGASVVAGFAPHRLTATAGPLTLEFRAARRDSFVCGGSPG